MNQWILTFSKEFIKSSVAANGQLSQWFSIHGGCRKGAQYHHMYLFYGPEHTAGFFLLFFFFLFSFFFFFLFLVRTKIWPASVVSASSLRCTGIRAVVFMGLAHIGSRLAVCDRDVDTGMRVVALDAPLVCLEVALPCVYSEEGGGSVPVGQGVSHQRRLQGGEV